jgi:hypothetical protein
MTVSMVRKSSRDMSKLKRTAYHEAGHAVAAYALRRAFRSVTIVPGEDFLGKIWLTKLSTFHPEYDNSSKTNRRVEEGIIINYAGFVAEGIFTGRNDYRGAHHDLVCAAALASNMVGSAEEEDAYLNYLWISTKNLMKLPHWWSATEALAKTLLEKKTLNHKHAKQVIQKAVEDSIKEEMDKSKRRMTETL